MVIYLNDLGGIPMTQYSQKLLTAIAAYLEGLRTGVHLLQELA